MSFGSLFFSVRLKLPNPKRSTSNSSMVLVVAMEVMAGVMVVSHNSANGHVYKPSILKNNDWKFRATVAVSK